MTKSRLVVLLQIGIVLSCALLISCQGSNPVMPNSQQMTSNSSMNQMATSATTSIASSRPVPTSATTDHGKATEMPAYYDDQLFTINFQELPPKAEQQAVTNPQLNFIYQCDACSSFTSVIDAIPSDGMNPLWEEVQITFLTIPEQQFTSDDEILAARDLGEISLSLTGEVYTCSVVGQKPN